MGKARTDLLQGTLDLLILKTLQVGQPMHGWGVAVRIQQVSDDTLQLNQGLATLRCLETSYRESGKSVTEVPGLDRYLGAWLHKVCLLSPDLRNL